MITFEIKAIFTTRAKFLPVVTKIYRYKLSMRFIFLGFFAEVLCEF